MTKTTEVMDCGCGSNQWFVVFVEDGDDSYMAIECADCRVQIDVNDIADHFLMN